MLDKAIIMLIMICPFHQNYPNQESINNFNKFFLLCKTYKIKKYLCALWLHLKPFSVLKKSAFVEYFLKLKIFNKISKT